MNKIAKQMDALFGELRSLLHGEQPQNGADLWGILSQAYALDAQWYEAQWRPYLSDRTLPVLTLNSPSMIEQARAILPTHAKCAIDLGGLKLGDARILEILSGANLPQIQRLSLRDNQLTARGIMAISRLKYAKNLTGLDVSDNSIGQEGVKSIVCNKGFKHIQHLGIENIQTNHVLAPFARSKLKLTQLDASRNRFHKDYKNRYWHAEPLAQDKCFKSLKVLNLRETLLCNDSLALLAHTANLSNLEQLNVSQNYRLSQPAMARMADRAPTWSKLSVLDLSACSFGQDGIVLFAHHVALPQLKRLILRQTYISTLMADALIILSEQQGVEVIVDEGR